MEQGPTMRRNLGSVPVRMSRMTLRDSAMNVACWSLRLISSWRDAGVGSGTFFAMCRSETFMMF